MERMLPIIVMLFSFSGSGLAADLKTGDPAPGIRLKTDTGELFDLESRRGKWTVLYFYPKADTPGCTKQACAFRDKISNIRKLGAEIYGISTDTVQALVRFKEKYHLNFVLLADPDMVAVHAYGTKMPALKFSKRWTFIVGPELKIRSVDKDVDPVLDAERVAEKLRTLQETG